MGSEGKRGTNTAGLIAVLLAALQIVLLTRYVNRLPGDALGIWLHAVAIVAWIVAAVLFFRNARSESAGKG
jgi:Na+-transporting NADH:ubiquinone oxidoreductase subunit NqrE